MKYRIKIEKSASGNEYFTIQYRNSGLWWILGWQTEGKFIGSFRHPHLIPIKYTSFDEVYDALQKLKIADTNESKISYINNV